MQQKKYTCRIKETENATKMQQSLCSKPYYLCHAFEQETILFNN